MRKTDIVDTANRGGLLYPTDTTFIISCLSYIFFNQMKENSLNTLLSSRMQHREVFIKSVVDILSTDPAFACICDIRCENNHMVLSNLLLCTFNCLSTNLKRQLTADNNEHKDTATTDRTVEQSSDRKKRKLLSNFGKKLLITFNVFNCKTKLCYNCCCECYVRWKRLVHMAATPQP